MWEMVTRQIKLSYASLKIGNPILLAHFYFENMLSACSKLIWCTKSACSYRMSPIYD